MDINANKKKYIEIISAVQLTEKDHELLCKELAPVYSLEEHDKEMIFEKFNDTQFASSISKWRIDLLYNAASMKAPCFGGTDDLEFKTLEIKRGLISDFCGNELLGKEAFKKDSPLAECLEGVYLYYGVDQPVDREYGIEKLISSAKNGCDHALFWLLYTENAPNDLKDKIKHIAASFDDDSRAILKERYGYGIEASKYTKNSIGF